MAGASEMRLSVLTISICGILFGALWSPMAQAQTVNYVLGRREDPDGQANAICLGNTLQAAYTYLGSENPADANYGPSESAVVQNAMLVNWTSAYNASFLYIGSFGTLGPSFYCASQTMNYLYNGSYFLSMGGDPLPGVAGDFSYVTSIWKANRTNEVNLSMFNDVDENLNVTGVGFNVTLEPQDTKSRKLPYNAFNQKVNSTLLEDFTQALSWTPDSVIDNFAYGTTYAAMIMVEADPTSDVEVVFVDTLYYFFTVYPAKSRWCNYTDWCPYPTPTHSRVNVSNTAVSNAVIVNSTISNATIINSVIYNSNVSEAIIINCTVIASRVINSWPRGSTTFKSAPEPCPKACVTGSAFEVAYDISTVAPDGFEALHCFYDPSTCDNSGYAYDYPSNRRRLLSKDISGRKMVRSRMEVPHLKNGDSRRRLATTTTTSTSRVSTTSATSCRWVNSCGTRPRTSTCYRYVCK